MYRLVLVLVLAAVTTSEQHLKIERRTEDIWDRCYGENYPSTQCISSASSYPVITAIKRARSFDGIKKVLKADGALEKLCEEEPRLLTCVSNVVKRASDECKEMYRNSYLLGGDLDKVVELIQQICTDENIEIAKRNLDCVIDECVLNKLYPCTLKNPDHDCSHLETNDYGPNPERRECYDEMYRRNCDAADVVQCAANKVSKACTAEVGSLVTLAGNGYLNLIPICRDGEHKLRTLLKYFK